RKNPQLITLPTGEQTTSPPPHIAEFRERVLLNKHRLQAEVSRKTLLRLYRYRAEHNLTLTARLDTHLEIIQLRPDYDPQDLFFERGYRLERVSSCSIPRPLNRKTQRIFQRLQHGFQRCSRIGRMYLTCPSTFFYEPGYIDFSKLGKLLNPESYYIDETYPEQVRSTNAKFKSSDGRHRVTVSYHLEEQARTFGIVVKYTAYGLKPPQDQDKLDIVLHLDENGVQSLLHLEAQLPQLVAETPELLRSMLSSTFSAQVKTDTRRGEQFAELSLLEGVMLRGSYSLPNRISNYKEILKDPSLIGGPTLTEVVRHAQTHFDVLQSIYAAKRAEGTQSF
ncbi:MAG TPA: hypothetical protein VJG90_04470, partial [Candidatus Nanoarchaeia archaeon]|nr:hypothetical protein [Candidatus Nanoarchaeia archaeon]